MLDPRTFPGKISETPSFTEIIPEINSGNEVPTPTIKIPITNGGNFNQVPICSAALVKNLAENKSAANAAKKIKILTIIIPK